MKKIIYIVLIFLCTTTSAWAVDLQPYIDDYLNKRYFTHQQVNIDFEQVTGFIEKFTPGTLVGLLIMNKNGNSFLLEMTSETNIIAISRNLIAPNYAAFAVARKNLLKAAAGDLSSTVKLQMVFQ